MKITLTKAALFAGAPVLPGEGTAICVLWSDRCY